jgi:hypothetical protein
MTSTSREASGVAVDLRATVRLGKSFRRPKVDG